MKTVQPIRDTDMIDEFKEEVKKRSHRDFIMVIIGFNTGLRIGDIVPLKVKDVRNKSHLSIHEQKTGKRKRFIISHIQHELSEYIEGKDDEDYLFESRQKNSEGILKNITPTQAYRRLKAVAVDLGIEEFGTHSLRKSFGYHYYNRTKDIAKLMYIFNHSSQSITMDYIGITQEGIDASLEGFFL